MRHEQHVQAQRRTQNKKFYRIAINSHIYSQKSAKIIVVLYKALNSSRFKQHDLQYFSPSVFTMNQMLLQPPYDRCQKAKVNMIVVWILLN